MYPYFSMSMSMSSIVVVGDSDLVISKWYPTRGLSCVYGVLYVDGQERGGWGWSGWGIAERDKKGEGRGGGKQDSRWRVMPSPVSPTVTFTIMKRARVAIPEVAVDRGLVACVVHIVSALLGPWQRSERRSQFHKGPLPPLSDPLPYYSC
jgi:hypothetical protein